MQHPIRLFAAAAIVLLASPAISFAHTGVGATAGFLSGVAHPLSGLDHLLAMFAVGLWAGQRGGNAVWLMPLAFLGVMTLGGVLGMAAVPLPFVERGIVASALIFGVLVAAAARLPLAAGVAIVGVFALCHGHAHGTEMPATASGAAYAAGFLATTAALQVAGIALATQFQRTSAAPLARIAGGAIAACGLYLLLM